MPEKPTPPLHPWTLPYWRAAREGRLLIQRCSRCQRHVFYPRLQCPECSSPELAWVEASGRGTVYSYSVVRNNPPTAFQRDVPFVIAIVELEEGVRMMTNIVECDPDEVRCDLPVEVIFERLDDEITLPKFKPSSRGETGNA